MPLLTFCAVDHEFPPLPKRTDTQSVAHSRVSSIQSGHSLRSGAPKIPPGLERVATPKVPPGLERTVSASFPPGSEDLHAHPMQAKQLVGKASPRKLESNSALAPISPVIPQVQLRASLKHDSDQAKAQTEVSNPEDKDNIAPTQLTVDGKAPLAEDDPKNRLDLLVSQHEQQGERAQHHSPDTPAQHLTKQHGKKQLFDTKPNTLASRSLETSTSPTPPSEKGEVLANMSITAATEIPDENANGSSSLSTPDATVEYTMTSRKDSKSEAKRPTLRTLNITSEMIETLRRSESQAPLSTTTEKSAPFPPLGHVRQSSRQPSISMSTNISRPSTPAASDLYGIFSQDVSRAGSPPPGGSVVGSAPSRQKTKNQAKKVRREKAKKATEASDAGSVTAVPTSIVKPEVGPIVARQKKQKKSKSANATTVTQPRKVVQKEHVGQVEEKIESLPIEPVHLSPEEQPDTVTTTEELEMPVMSSPPALSKPASPDLVPVEEVSEPYTLRDFYTDASRLQSQFHNDESITEEQIRAKMQDVLGSHVSPLQKLLSDMVASGDLVKDHPFFNPPAFVSAPYKLPPDNRKGQAYLDGNNYSSNDVFGMIYLPQKEKKALYHGHAVSIADPAPAPSNSGGTPEPKEDLLRRCLITPTGWVLRHLSRDESEKLLDLEEKRQMYVEEFGDLGKMDGLGAVEENDYVNLEGGFEEINRFGDRHGVCWLMDQQSYRGGHRTASRTNDDDYGLGEMPVDGDDFDDDDDDRYDDPDDLDDEGNDEEELDGEDLIQRVVARDDNGYDANDDADLGSFANLTGDPSMSMTLPPLPPSMMMNMDMGLPPGSSNAWGRADNNSYPIRSNHSMYGGSLNTPSGYGAGTYAGGGGTGYAVDEMMLPPASELPVNSRNAGSNILPPIRQDHATQPESRVNLRMMNDDELARRVREKQKEMESAKRESDRLEKLMVKKSKDLGRWRESIFKGVMVGGN